MRTIRSIVLSGVAALALTGVAWAEGTAAQEEPTAVERGAAETTNELDQAAGPETPITAEEMRAAVALDGVSDAKDTLATAAVQNKAGEALGEVRSVALAADGTADAINVEVGGFLGVGERIVALDADSFVYLQDRKILVTNMTKEQIEALPAISG